MAYITNPEEPRRHRGLLRWSFPLIVLFLCGAAVAMPILWTYLGPESETPIPLFMAQWLAPPLGLLLLSAWWLIFSGVYWPVRLALLAVPFLIAPISYFLCVRSVEFTTKAYGLVPRFHFNWEPTAQELLNEFQEKQAKGADELLPPLDATVGPEDFPGYRGSKRDGVISHLKLKTNWTAQKPELLWERPSVGGYSGIAVAGNLVVTIEQRYGQEVIVGFDRATGRERWSFGYDANYVDVMGSGPRSTPTIHDNLIFTIGAMGDLVCVDINGKKQWSVNLLEECKAKNITWGLSGSPLIVDDLVIANAGIDPKAPMGDALVAFDYKTGKKRWGISSRKAGYSSPQLVTLDNVQQVLLFDGEALAGFDAKLGNELWQTPWVTKMEMNMIQPVVIGGDRVFISSEPSNGCALYRVIAPENNGKWKVETVWQTKSLGARFANPVSDGKRIFGLHGLPGVLKCIDVNDGRELWRGERYGDGGQMLLVDDLLLIVSASGELSLVKTEADTAEALARQGVFNDKTWNTPTIAGDQLFVRNQFTLACWRLPRK